MKVHGDSYTLALCAFYYSCAGCSARRSRSSPFFGAVSNRHGPGRAGVLFIPLMGLVTVARGGLIGVVAVLYILFACGALMRKNWGWWAGLVAAVINALLVLSLVMQGEAVVHSLVWTIVPAILLWYLFSPPGRELLKS